MMKKLSDRFQYYSGILCATGMNVDINDLVHISALLEAEEQGLLRKVEQGEWIKTFRYMRKNINTGKLEPVYSCDCPICKYHTGNQGVRFNFCPNCGADMRGKKNE